MNEINEYSAWKRHILEQPDEITKHCEIYEKFEQYKNSIIITGFLPESIVQFTDEFLNTVITSIADILLNFDINEISSSEKKIIKLYFNSFFDLGLYGALSHEKTPLSVLLLLLNKSNKPLFNDGDKKKFHSSLLRKFYLKGAIQAFQHSIETSQNIELLSLVLELTSKITKYDPFFNEQLFFDITIDAIKHIISLNKEIVSVKFLNSSFDSIEQFIPFSDEAYIYFVKTVLPILFPFITSENLEQRSNALSQFLKYAKADLSKKEVVQFFTVNKKFSIFGSVNLHSSLSQKIGELMSIIISNSQMIGKRGIIKEIWNEHENMNKSSFDLPTFYDTFMYLGAHLKSFLFDEFIEVILNENPSFSWFEMIDKLSTILSKESGMKETFKKIRQRLWFLIDSFDQDSQSILSFCENAKNSLIHMIGFNADESDLTQIKNLNEKDPQFFYLLLKSFLENKIKIDEKTISEFLVSLLHDLSDDNHSPIMINDIKLLCDLCNSLSNKQLRLLMKKIEYFPDFFDFMSQLNEKSILRTKDVTFICNEIQTEFINLDFYKFLKKFISKTTNLEKCITKLPFSYENLIWKFSCIDSPARINFAKFLCRIYQMNDGKQLTDEQIIEKFLTEWANYFESYINGEEEEEGNEISNLLKLLWIFIDIYESNMYRIVNNFGSPLSIKRSNDIFTVNVKCEKPEFNILLKYPINYTIESIIEEVIEKYKKPIGLNKINAYYNGKAMKRSAAIKDFAENQTSIHVELKVEDEIYIPHKYHIRTKIPSMYIIANDWYTKYFENLIKEGKEEAYEVLKLLPSTTKKIDFEQMFNENDDSDYVFGQVLDKQLPYLFSYNFLLIYSSTLNDYELLVQLVKKGIVEYLLKMIIDFNPDKIFVEIIDVFNLFILNVLKKIDGFPINLRNGLIFTLLSLAEKGFDVNSMKPVFSQLLAFNRNELKFSSFQPIQLLFHPNPQTREFAMNVFKTIEIDLNEYMNILRNRKEEINEEFIQSLSHHISATTDLDIIHEITCIILKLQTQFNNRNGYFLKASLILFNRFLIFNFLNYERRQLVLQLIIERLITTNFLDEDLIAFGEATNCLKQLATSEVYALHKVLNELHSNRKPFSQYSIDGSRCSISKTGRVGLQRIGNTCYFNTIMQMLFSIKPIRNIIMSYDGNDNFLNEMSKLFVLMKKVKARSINTQQILEYLTFSDGSKVDISMQQDAAEFLQIIINKCEPVEKLFLGKSVDIYEGHEFEEVREELFIILDLDVQNIPSLFESFEVFSKDVLLIGSNQYLDERTNKKIDVKKCTKIKEAPPFLIIHLKRFESIDLDNIGAKIDDVFEIPFEFDISPFSTQNFPIYRLTGVIVHWGTASNGHYICLSLTKKGWVKIDDMKSTFIEQKEMIKLIQGGSNQCSAYILFYTMENDVKYPKCVIKPELLEYANEMNKINNNKRLFCSFEYFNLINTLNNLIQIDYHDIVLRYAIDSLPFMEIENEKKPIFENFYKTLFKKSKMGEIMLIEKFRFLDYSLMFLREDILLCPHLFIRKNTADLILVNLNEKASPHQFLIFIFDNVKISLNYSTQFDQVFYIIYSILNKYEEIRENPKIQNILYKLLENDLIPFINKNPNFSEIDMTYILEIVNMYKVYQLLNKNNFLDQLFASNTCVDSIVEFIKLVFNNDEDKINEFIDKNIPQISIQKLIPFYFFFNRKEAIQISFQKLADKRLKVSGIRNPDIFDVVCIFADLLSKCQSLSRSFNSSKEMKIWIPKLLLNPTSKKVRQVALSIFSYTIPHEKFKKWNFSKDYKKGSNQPRPPYDLTFASIRDNSCLNVYMVRLLANILNFMLSDETVHDIKHILKNTEKNVDDDICVEYFQILEELLMLESHEIDAKKSENVIKIYNSIVNHIKNPFSDSLIYSLMIISKFNVPISQESLESGLKSIKSFSKYINDEKFEQRFNRFLTYYLDLYSKFEPSKSFLNNFITNYVFSPDMTSEWKPIINYIESIFSKKGTKADQLKTIKIANNVIKIIDSNYKTFANNNFSSLIFLLDQIKKAISKNDVDHDAINKMKRPIFPYLKDAIEKPQYLNINIIIKIACELNDGDINKQVIKVIMEKYKYEIDNENMNLLNSISGNGNQNSNKGQSSTNKGNKKSNSHSSNNNDDKNRNDEQSSNKNQQIDFKKYEYIFCSTSTSYSNFDYSESEQG